MEQEVVLEKVCHRMMYNPHPGGMYVYAYVCAMRCVILQLKNMAC